MPAQKHPLQLLAEWFQVLGVDFPAEVTASGGIIQAFTVCKERAKANFKRLAMEHHPDRGSDGERFKAITEAWNRLKVVEIKRRPRPIAYTMVCVQVFTGTTVTESGTSTVPFT